MRTETLSVYYSDKSEREAILYKILDEGSPKYLVSSSDESGNVVSNFFDALDLAEDFSEDYVMHND
jgi:hypothetical protein